MTSKLSHSVLQLKDLSLCTAVRGSHAVSLTPEAPEFAGALLAMPGPGTVQKAERHSHLQTSSNYRETARQMQVASGMTHHPW